MSTSNYLRLGEYSDNGALLASRVKAAEIRKSIEKTLRHTEESITIDFDEVCITQSFADELVGILAYKFGRPGMQRLHFKNCTEDHKKILNFVVSHRISTQRIVVNAPQTGTRITALCTA